MFVILQIQNKIRKSELMRKGRLSLRGRGFRRHRRAYLVSCYLRFECFVINTAPLLLGDKALLGCVEVAVRVKLIVHELRGRGGAEGALHGLLGNDILGLVLVKAAQTDEIEACAAS